MPYILVPPAGCLMNVGVASQSLLFRKALCALLTGAGISSCVTEVCSVLDLADSSDKSQPLVLLVHTTTPIDGIASVHELRELHPEARIILLADHPDEESCAQALEAGAWGCLSTTENPQLLIKAISKVAEGERWFAHRVTSIVVERLVASRGMNTKFAGNLTPREWEVLVLIAKGLPDKEVASRLFISRETARSHTKSIFKKLQVSTRRAAAVYYFRHVRGQNSLPETPQAAAIPDVA